MWVSDVPGYFVEFTKYPTLRLALATLLSFGHYDILIYGYKTIAENFLKNDFTIFGYLFHHKKKELFIDQIILNFSPPAAAGQHFAFFGKK